MKKKCWVVIYYHRHGTDAWPVWSARRPSENAVIQTLQDWEGDSREDEWLEIRGPFQEETNDGKDSKRASQRNRKK